MQVRSKAPKVVFNVFIFLDQKKRGNLNALSGAVCTPLAVKISRTGIKAHLTFPHIVLITSSTGNLKERHVRISRACSRKRRVSLHPYWLGHRHRGQAR
ncbi:hypothetical protein, partial [Pseudomonas corrugata]|uniref:hypothetical protein n=1 Tax=Pseudomonas corrugata TaxID=47879 RepID=UPI003EDA467D